MSPLNVNFPANEYWYGAWTYKTPRGAKKFLILQQKETAAALRDKGQKPLSKVEWRENEEAIGWQQQWSVPVVSD